MSYGDVSPIAVYIYTVTKEELLYLQKSGVPAGLKVGRRFILQQDNDSEPASKACWACLKSNGTQCLLTGTVLTSVIKPQPSECLWDIHVEKAE